MKQAHGGPYRAGVGTPPSRGKKALRLLKVVAIPLWVALFLTGVLVCALGSLTGWMYWGVIARTRWYVNNGPAVPFPSLGRWYSTHSVLKRGGLPLRAWDGFSCFIFDFWVLGDREEPPEASDDVSP